MCLLTYIPTANNGFFLTSNRDESVARQDAIAPRKYYIKGKYVFYPKDPVSDGTWIASNGEYTLCLLNGGFVRHHSTPPYRQSRGRIIPDFFEYYSIENFSNNYQFAGIEPFTLVIVNANDFVIKELTWTGEKLVTRNIEWNEPHIWSSSTLYSPGVVSQRATWFTDFLRNNDTYEAEEILNFHRFGGNGDPHNDLLMNRNNVLRTVSITQFEFLNHDFRLSYYDLLNDKDYFYRIITDREPQYVVK